MTRIWMVLSLSLAVTFGASAQDQPWPESVAPAHAAYEAAIAARDFEAAYAAAETAWRAGREAQIEPARIGLLAQNYARLALVFRQYDAAYEAWRNAAEISDNSGGLAAEGAIRWYGAATAAFASGNLAETQQAALRAGELGAASQPPLEIGLRGNIEYMVAVTSSELGETRLAGEHARLALAAFGEARRARDLAYANAFFISGTAHFEAGESVASAVAFGLAQQIYRGLDGPERVADAGRSSDWQRRARQDLSAEEDAQVTAEVAAFRFPETGEPGVDYPQPIIRLEPRYPDSALRRGTQGHVRVQFAITEAGRVEDIEVLESEPPGVFDRACIAAVRQWRFEPILEDGVPQRRVTDTEFTFRVERH